MLNREKYANEIIDTAINDIGLKDGKPVSCFEISCVDCDFYDYNHGCDGEAKKWLNSEYVEPPVDWSKVAVDTPILVKDINDEEWKKRYFAKYEDGIVYAWGDGTTSWSAYRSNDITDWEMAKLTESENTGKQTAEIKALELKSNSSWIPCSEKLPPIRDKNCPDNYPVNLVTLENGNVCLGVYKYDEDKWWTRTNEGCTAYGTKYKVIAWMPLPESYKESEE